MRPGSSSSSGGGGGGGGGIRGLAGRAGVLVADAAAALGRRQRGARVLVRRGEAQRGGDGGFLVGKSCGAALCAGLAVEDVAAASLAHLQDVVVAASGGVRQALLFLLLALGRRPDDDYGNRGLLETVFGDGPGEEGLDASEVAAACADDEDGGFVDSNLTGELVTYEEKKERKEQTIRWMMSCTFPTASSRTKLMAFSS